jgi:alpha,alpha-trehalase
MKYLFDYWTRLKRRLLKRHMILFLDYDGTITPIVEKPDSAVLFPKIKTHLAKLARKSRCRIVVISGRALDDLRRRVKIPGITYAGNHGLEIRGPRVNFVYPVPPKIMKAVGRLKCLLTTCLFRFEGALLEDKHFSLSLHYRNVRKKDRPLALKAFQGIVRPYVRNKMIKARTGKEVLEIVPAVEWDKGHAVRLLSKRNAGYLPMYLGDDATDEDAFRELRNKGPTICVGKTRKSRAVYYLNGTAEVAKLIETLLKTK